MFNWAAFAIAVLITIFLTFLINMGYMAVMKPDCRAGFTPLIGWGAGWYCAPGYKP